MAEYHVGCGVFAIYAGTLNKKGNMWRNKSEVTDEAISAAAQYLLEHDQLMRFNYRGKRYEIKVVESQETTAESEDVGGECKGEVNE